MKFFMKHVVCNFSLSTRSLCKEEWRVNKMESAILGPIVTYLRIALFVEHYALQINIINQKAKQRFKNLAIVVKIKLPCLFKGKEVFKTFSYFFQSITISTKFLLLPDNPAKLSRKFNSNQNVQLESKEQSSSDNASRRSNLSVQILRIQSTMLMSVSSHGLFRKVFRECKFPIRTQK